MRSRLESGLSYLLPKFSDVVFIALFVGVVGLGPRIFNIDGDLGRHLTIGKYILDHRQIPTQDIFSHSMSGAPLTPHEWLAQVIFALSFAVGGLDGVVWLSAVLIAATFTANYLQSWARSRSIFLALFWTILAAAASSLHWLARPHLFTMFLIIPWIVILERIRRGESNRWWLLPILMLFWANLHGAFIAGFVILGAYLLGDLWQSLLVESEAGWRLRIRPYLYAAGGSILATLINPAGGHLWETSLGYIRNRYLVGHTAEYLPPNFHEASNWPFLLMVGLSFLVLGMNRATIHPAHIFLVSGWGMMGLYSVRNVPIFALVAAPILAEASVQVLKTLRIGRTFFEFDRRIAAIEASLRGYVWPINILIAIAMAYGAGIDLDFNRQGNRFDGGTFPVEAVDWMQKQPQKGSVFNYFPWGGYLLYRDWPRTRVFIDGQTDFYGEQLTRLYEQVLTLEPGWQEVFRDYQVDWVLMPTDSALVRTLGQDPSWLLVYQDPTATIFDNLQ